MITHKTLKNDPKPPKMPKKKLKRSIFLNFAQFCLILGCLDIFQQIWLKMQVYTFNFAQKSRKMGQNDLKRRKNSSFFSILGLFLWFLVKIGPKIPFQKLNFWRKSQAKARHEVKGEGQNAGDLGCANNGFGPIPSKNESKY